jgi:hypothetical protein
MASRVFKAPRGMLGLPGVRVLSDRHFARLLAIVVPLLLVVTYLWNHVLTVLFAPHPPPAEDFYQYLQGAVSLRSLGDPYAIPDPSLHAPWDYRITTTYIYPPLFAVLLVPLTFLSPSLVVRGWVVLMQVLAVLAVALVYRALGRPGRGELVAVTVAVATFMPLIATALTGAMNPILLLLCALALPPLLRGQQRRAGVWLGLAIGIKLFPAGLLPYLLFRRLGRALLYVGLTVAATIAVGVAVTRPVALAHYLFDLLPALGEGNGYRENQSFLGFFTRLCSPGGLDGASAGPGACARAFTLSADVLLLVGLWWAITRGSLAHRPEAAHRRQRALEYALALFSIPLLASISWGLHLILMLLPIAILLRYLFAEDRWTPKRALVVIGALACFSVVRGGYYTVLAQPWLAQAGGAVQAVVRGAGESYLAGLLLFWGLTFLLLREAKRTSLLELRRVE